MYQNIYSYYLNNKVHLNKCLLDNSTKNIFVQYYILDFEIRNKCISFTTMRLFCVCWISNL